MNHPPVPPSLTMAVVAVALSDVGLQERHPRNEAFDFVLGDDSQAAPVKVEVTSSLTADVSIQTAFVSNVATLNISSARGTMVHIVDLQSSGVSLEVQNTLRSLKIVVRLCPVGSVNVQS
ncbi:hypothetical protein FPV67DRAFT_1668699 [Lyophyllum atratum]|nr:hypothetical protein FPV67DRAFT_1668699 [Lyophyllum atratum]